eukprot:4858521-Karenia_brevis.AAC.1
MGVPSVYTQINLERVVPAVERTYGKLVNPPPGRYQRKMQYGAEYITSGVVPWLLADKRATPPINIVAKDNTLIQPDGEQF